MSAVPDACGVGPRSVVLCTPGSFILLIDLNLQCCLLGPLSCNILCQGSNPYITCLAASYTGRQLSPVLSSALQLSPAVPNSLHLSPIVSSYLLLTPFGFGWHHLGGLLHDLSNEALFPFMLPSPTASFPADLGAHSFVDIFPLKLLSGQSRQTLLTKACSDSIPVHTCLHL